MVRFRVKSFSICALLLSLAFLSCRCPGQAAPAAPEGSWQGTLDAGSAKLRLVLTITKSGGEYKGILESVDQGATIPAEKVTVNGDKLRADFPRVNGFYEGTLNKQGTEIAGSWTQNGGTLPLAFKRAESTKAVATKDDSKATPAEKAFTSPIDVTIPLAPTAFQANGKTHLVYELHIVNFSAQNTVLTQIAILSDTGAELGRMEQTELLSNTMPVGNRDALGMDKLNLGGGASVVVFMWVTVDGSAKVPAALEHKITVKVGKNQDELSVLGARTVVSRDIAVIGAPLRGDNWEAANGPSSTSAHRRAIIPIEGKAVIAQRFAIDWVRLNPDGKSFTGDPKDNKNYRAYGSEALAVADGVVTEVKDGIPENVPGINSRAVPITLETVGGNHVILDIGHGRYGFYAHMQPGSLKVKLGDHVKGGQVLGLVGNSGNSTEPHLHFHLSNANSPLGSEGIPYALESFETKGKADAPPVKHKLEIPTEAEIVTFEK
ncbi:MAG TPA: M23 family metallopeptidase [Candidatus Angelobacter sp.]|nr:M23 family metallopeptidase [Candidatus Angelobacter sp.]